MTAWAIRMRCALFGHKTNQDRNGILDALHPDWFKEGPYRIRLYVILCRCGAWIEKND